jgi:hypothetical protein
MGEATDLNMGPGVTGGGEGRGGGGYKIVERLQNENVYYSQ